MYLICCCHKLSSLPLYVKLTIQMNRNVTSVHSAKRSSLHSHILIVSEHKLHYLFKTKKISYKTRQYYQSPNYGNRIIIYVSSLVSFLGLPQLLLVPRFSIILRRLSIENFSCLFRHSYNKSYRSWPRTLTCTGRGCSISPANGSGSMAQPLTRTSCKLVIFQPLMGLGLLVFKGNVTKTFFFD